MSAIKAVQKKSAEQMAADALRESIISGATPPGSRLTEIALADQLQLSRATTRVALHYMALEGLVVQIPYTGWVVTSLTSNDAWELYTLRASLEALAARLASERLSEVGANSLKRALSTLEKRCKSGERSEIPEADFALHKTIVLQSGHKRLAEQYRLVEQQIRMYIASSDALIQDPEVIAAQHRPIIEAILKGHAGEAARLSEEHNTYEGQKLVDRLKAIEKVSSSEK